MGIAAIVVIAAVGVYGIIGGKGNGDALCRPAVERAKTLAPLSTGELAAFQPATRAIDLGHLTFTGDDGKTKKVSDFAGKVALVNLWASWCMPCREEMPALDRLAGARAGQDFAVVPVSIDTGGPDKPRGFLHTVHTQNLPLYVDPSMKIFEDMKKQSLALGLPVTVLLDRTGCLLGHINGPAEWDSPDAAHLIQAALDAPAGKS
ncbi:Thiol-disulfide isomerase or thioredoxin [Faunimonas pinastri]|uniref:Thiol-disulfide isomerase or thioredoxin n=1 Tax=Faunimonas pinastri TaxID=1855383 RepID=A0A1H9HSC3_9HYPH|nr:TlpA disulfide reductase family protein [Faunimonas pinastri]SEQ65197.1 Thiol-disulfide isomerase or thioredoxin [Faunimonas pinastri]